MVELAEEIVQDIINYLTTHQTEIGVMTMLLFRNEILNNIKYVIFSSIKRVSAKKWRFESLDIPINFDGIKEEYITENGGRKRSIILTGNMFTNKEKHNLNQIIGLWKNKKWGYVTILEPDKDYLTFCNIRAVQKDKKNSVIYTAI